MDKQNIYRTSVSPEWIDHNDHMNVAYYVLAFDEATDAVYERWGIGLHCAATHGCSVFTVGMNVDYFDELFAGDDIRIETTLVDYDQKRVHYVHRMFNEKTRTLAATNECLGLNVDIATRKSTVFPGRVFKQLDDAVDRDQELEQLGRVLSIRHR